MRDQCVAYSHPGRVQLTEVTELGDTIHLEGRLWSRGIWEDLCFFQKLSRPDSSSFDSLLINLQWKAITRLGRKAYIIIIQWLLTRLVQVTGLNSSIDLTSLRGGLCRLRDGMIFHLTQNRGIIDFGRYIHCLLLVL